MKSFQLAFRSSDDISLRTFTNLKKPGLQRKGGGIINLKKEETSDLPGPGVAIFRFSVVENVFLTPVGYLLTTQQKLDFMWVESLQLLHGKYSVKTSCK